MQVVELESLRGALLGQHAQAALPAGGMLDVFTKGARLSVSRFRAYLPKLDCHQPTTPSPRKLWQPTFDIPHEYKVMIRTHTS